MKFLTVAAMFALALQSMGLTINKDLKVNHNLLRESHKQDDDNKDGTTDLPDFGADDNNGDNGNGDDGNGDDDNGDDDNGDDDNGDDDNGDDDNGDDGNGDDDNGDSGETHA